MSKSVVLLALIYLVTNVSDTVEVSDVSKPVVLLALIYLVTNVSDTVEV